MPDFPACRPPDNQHTPLSAYVEDQSIRIASDSDTSRAFAAALRPHASSTSRSTHPVSAPPHVQAQFLHNTDPEQGSDLLTLWNHCSYFDPNNDGLIYPWNTFSGCRRFGWSLISCTIVTILIHLELYFATSSRHWLLRLLSPHPLLPIRLDRIVRGLHRDSMWVFGTDGRFRYWSHDYLILRHDKGKKGGLTKWDVARMLSWQKQERELGWWGLLLVAWKWFLAYCLIWPDDGVMREYQIRKVFDGSIFYQKAAEHCLAKAKAKAKRKGKGKEKAL